MAKKELQASIEEQTIASRIYIVREQKVMLDEDLARMYKVETRRLNEQVKRNASRFPEDFMFTLTQEEYQNLKSQNATSKTQGGRRKLPNAFTEQGVAMLSSVLSSDVAIAVNISIIRVFTKLRQYALGQKDILLQIAQLEGAVQSNSRDIENIFAALKDLLEQQHTSLPRKKIGFKHYDEKAEE